MNMLGGKAVDVTNCPVCGEIYLKNKFRAVCEKCWKKEEEAFDLVYRYMRKRENWAATTLQIVEATGVPEELILKFVKAGRLKTAQFPNLGYPCDKCGTIIREGRLCSSCATELRNDLLQHEHEEERKRERSNPTFFTQRK